MDRDKLEGLSNQLTEVLLNHPRRQSLPYGMGAKVQGDCNGISIYTTTASTSQLISTSHAETRSCTIGAPFPTLAMSEKSPSAQVKTVQSTKFEFIKTKLTQNNKFTTYSNGSSDSEIKKGEKAPKRRKSRSEKKNDKVSLTYSQQLQPLYVYQVSHFGDKIGELDI